MHGGAGGRGKNIDRFDRGAAGVSIALGQAAMGDGAVDVDGGG